MIDLHNPVRSRVISFKPLPVIQFLRHRFPLDDEDNCMPMAIFYHLKLTLPQLLLLVLDPENKSIMKSKPIKIWLSFIIQVV